MTPAFLRASIDGEIADARRVLGLSLPEGWPDIVAVLEMRLEQLANNPELQPWLLRAIALSEQRVMIGHIGFHTAPGASYLQEWCPAGVEFGCTIFAPYRRQGYAREASKALMQWALDTHGVTDFVVTVGRTNIASRKLAHSLEFREIGSHVDEVDGVEDVYFRRLEAAA